MVLYILSFNKTGYYYRKCSQVRSHWIEKKGNVETDDLQVNPDGLTGPSASNSVSSEIVDWHQDKNMKLEYKLLGHGKQIQKFRKEHKEVRSLFPCFENEKWKVK